MELSILCDLKMFLFIYDARQERVIHYASDPMLDLVDLFNKKAQREYYTNADYNRVGGRDQEFDTGDLLDADNSAGEDDAVNAELVLDSEDKCDLSSGKSVVVEKMAADQANLSALRRAPPKIFSSKRKDGQVTSRIGSLLQQKLPVAPHTKQVVEMRPELATRGSATVSAAKSCKSSVGTRQQRGIDAGKDK